MGKKGKKKGSGGKKKGKKGKKGKSSEPEMSWKEALLAYQINIKERQIEDVRYELRSLEDKHQRHLERNDRLQQEQLFYMNNLLKQAKDFEKKIAEEDVIDKKQVVEVMMNKWEAARQEEKNVAGLKEQIARMETDILRETKQVEYWTEYQRKGQYEHKKQIQLLEQELVDMQSSFEEMAAHLERTLTQAKSEIEKHTDDTLDKQKYLASEKAMAKMDKGSRQEVLDNDWLKREVEIHKREVNELMSQVEVVEKDNLDVMSQLFECTVDDLKISRNFFLTQFAEKDNLEESGILETDLAKLKLEGDDTDTESVVSAIKRPKSVTQKYIEDKVFGKDVARIEEDDEDESDYDGENDAEDSDEDDPFNNYFNFDDEDFDDYLQLGPLELKLLSIQGTQMPIHRPKTPSKEELQAQQYSNYEWPMTQAIANRNRSHRN